MTTPDQARPELIVRGRGVTARFRETEVVLERREGRRRIPVRAIECVRVDGAEGRTMQIVLTAADGAGEVYRLTGGTPQAVTLFCERVNGALPVRDRDEPRPDGAALVTLEPAERDSGPSLNAWLALAGLAALYVTGLVIIILDENGGWDPALGWGFFGPLCLVMAPVAFVEGMEKLEEWREERQTLRIGITVPGTCHSVDRDEDGSVTDCWFEFTTADGRMTMTKRSSPLAQPGEEVEVTYDPEDPHRTVIGNRARGLLRCLLACLSGVTLGSLGLYFLLGSLIAVVMH